MTAISWDIDQRELEFVGEAMAKSPTSAVYAWCNLLGLSLLNVGRETNIPYHRITRGGLKTREIIDLVEYVEKVRESKGIVQRKAKMLADIDMILTGARIQGLPDMIESYEARRANLARAFGPLPRPELTLKAPPERPEAKEVTCRYSGYTWTLRRPTPPPRCGCCQKKDWQASA